MYLTHLYLSDFRNYANLDIDVSRGNVLIIGANAQGKTSLLEAIYYLATFTSFNATHDRQLIHFMAGREPLAVARIIADFCRHDDPLDPERFQQHRLEIRLIQEPNGTRLNGMGEGVRLRKEYLQDGVKRKMSEVVGFFNAVLFLPQMLQVIEGPPEERRRYLNLLMAQGLPGFGQALADYNQALTQRNALLKALSERGADPNSSASQLVYWDELLARTGAEIIYARIQVIQELERISLRIHRELTRQAEILRLSYQPSYEPLSEAPGQFLLPIKTALDRTGISREKIHLGFQEYLERIRVEEVSRGVTTVGPHRDELRFTANGIDLGTYGSRGQARSAILSLKLAEVAWLKEKTGQWPVLLLDEVLAELDIARRDDLMNRLTQSEQALLTSTDLNLFSPGFLKYTTIWSVKEGRIEKG